MQNGRLAGVGPCHLHAPVTALEQTQVVRCLPVVPALARRLNQSMAAPTPVIGVMPEAWWAARPGQAAAPSRTGV